MAGGRARAQGCEVTAEELFWRLAAELQAEDSRIAEGTIMNGRCLRVGKEFLALVDYKGSGLVVKLPKARVAELIESGAGQPFAPAGRVFRSGGPCPSPIDGVGSRSSVRGSPLSGSHNQAAVARKKHRRWRCFGQAQSYAFTLSTAA